jgi:hypothetical protein
MKGGPSKSACRSRLQTAVSCWSRKAAGGERLRKRCGLTASGAGERDERKRTVDEASKHLQTAPKPERPHSPGRACAVTYLLAMRCPVYRQRDFHLGFDTELENLIGGGKGKGTRGNPARPKVPKRRSGADCSVVALKRGNSRGAKGAGHLRRNQFGSTGNGRNLLISAEGGSLQRVARAG